MIFGRNVEVPLLTCSFSIFLVLNSFPNLGFTFAVSFPHLCLLFYFVYSSDSFSSHRRQSRCDILSELFLDQREKSLAKCLIHMQSEASDWLSITQCDLVKEPVEIFECSFFACFCQVI